MEPKVSVIVCTYNQEDTIGAALDSILAQQTDFDFEIVVADDASADRTPDICRDYARRYPHRVRAILNNENKGVADNYFCTLYECRGRYIADLAGDDVWLDTGKLARQAAILDADPSVVLVHSAWRFLLPDGSLKEPDHHAVPAESSVSDGAALLMPLFQHSNDKYFIHLCASMYRRDTAIALSQKYSDFFFGRELPCEDYQLEVLMAANGRIASEPSVVLGYRTGHASVSSEENPAKSAVFAARIARLTCRLADELCFDKSLLAGYFSRQMLFAIAQAFASGNRHARAEVAAAVDCTKPELPRRARAALMLMKIPPVWWVARTIYKLK